MTKRLFLSIAIILCAVTIIKAQKSAESNTSGGWIGLTTSASGNGTVTVTDIISGGPAEQAGMKTGYVVTQVNGAPIVSRDEFEAAVAQSTPGTKLSISYRVGMSGAWQATRVITVAKRPESGVVDRTPRETETSAKSAVASSALLPKNQRVTASDSPSAPSVLTNSDVLALLKIGISSEIISAKLKYSSTSFDTSPAALQQLKLAGASDGLMMAMVQAAPVSTSQTIPAISSQPTLPSSESNAKSVLNPAVHDPSRATGVGQESAGKGECVILKRMGPADQITSHMYSFGIRGKQFQYVEGQFPSGVTFHGRLTDNDIRNVQKKGGRVVIMEPKYNADDLREAKQSCKYL